MDVLAYSTYSGYTNIWEILLLLQSSEYYLHLSEHLVLLRFDSILNLYYLSFYLFGMSRDETRLRVLARKKGIQFNGWADEETWPECHRSLFTKLKSIQDIRFDAYISGPDNTEWKSTTIRRVTELRGKADRFADESGNEAQRRLGLEDIIFSRFHAEILCKRCGNRARDAEAETPLNTTDMSRTDLENRQRVRQPCRCDNPRQPYTLDPLFSSRCQENVLYDAEVGEDKQPDRVIGLKASKTLREILDRDETGYPNDTGAHFQDVRITPFKNGADPLVLPFVVHEAKSRKAAENFDSMYVEAPRELGLLCLPLLTTRSGRPKRPYQYGGSSHSSLKYRTV